MYHLQVEPRWVCERFHLLCLFYAMVVNVLVQIGRQHIMEACLHKLELIDATFSTWRVETDAQKVGATDDGANLESLVELG